MGKSLKNRKDKYGVFICPVCYFSNKKDKQIANRKFRHRSKHEAHLSTLEETDQFKTYDLDQVSNVWCFSGDGLAYYVKFSDGHCYDGSMYTEKDIRRMKAK